MTYIILFLGFLIQAIGGFGGGLFSVPLLTLLHEPRFIVPAFAIAVWIMNIVIAFETHRHIVWPRVMKIVAPCWIGLPIGIYTLANINQDLLRLFISALTLVLGVIFLFGIRPRLNDSALSCISVGVISGVLSGGAAMGGPPLIFMAYAMGWEKEEFRSTLVTCFAINGVFSIVLFHFNGLLQMANMRISLLALPLAAAAVILGINVKNRLNEKWFAKLTLFLIILIGLMGIVRFLF